MPPKNSYQSFRGLWKINRIIADCKNQLNLGKQFHLWSKYVLSFSFTCNMYNFMCITVHRKKFNIPTEFILINKLGWTIYTLFKQLSGVLKIVNCINADYMNITSVAIELCSSWFKFSHFKNRNWDNKDSSITKDWTKCKRNIMWIETLFSARGCDIIKKVYTSVNFWFSQWNGVLQTYFKSYAIKSIE